MVRNIMLCKKIISFFQDEYGGISVEFGLLVTLVALVAAAALTPLGDTIQQSMTCSVVAFVPEYAVDPAVGC